MKNKYIIKTAAVLILSLLSVSFLLSPTKALCADNSQSEEPFFVLFKAGSDIANVTDTSGKTIGSINCDSVYYRDGERLVYAYNDKEYTITSSGKIIDYDLDAIYASNDGMAAVIRDGKFGFLDSDGNLAIDCIYSDADSFSGGLAPVKIKGKYGFIDKTGKLVIPAKYSYALPFMGDVAAVQKKAGPFAFIKKNGKRLTGYKYECFSLSYENDNGGFTESDLILVLNVKTDKYGILSHSGKWILKCKYDEIQCMDKNIISAANDDGANLYNSKGKRITTGSYDEIDYSFNDGLVRVLKDNRYGYIDKKGKEVIACKYTAATPFSDGHAIVEKDEEQVPWLLHKSGRELMELVELRDCEYYLRDGIIHYGPFCIDDRDVYQYMNLEGEILSSYSDGYYADYFYSHDAGFVNDINTHERCAIIDRDGNVLLRIEPSGSVSEFGDGFLAVYNKKKLWCIVNDKGSAITPYKYTAVKHEIKDGLIAVCSSDKLWGYVDRFGKEIIPCQYEYAQSFTDGYAAVRKNGKWGIINTSGEIVVPFENSAVYIVGPDYYSEPWEED